MGRWILIFAGLFALCAALNVLIAWTCVLMQDEIEFDGALLGRLRAAEWEGHGVEPSAGQPEKWLQFAFTGHGVNVIRLRERHDSRRLSRTPVSGDVQVTIVRAGWPMRSMEGREHSLYDDAAALADRQLVFAVAVDGEISLRFTPTFQRPPGAIPTMHPPIGIDMILPSRPLWPGFLINVLLYAVVLLLMWAVWRTTNTLGRLSRGECPRCGYPVGVSPRCTECGRAVKPRTPAAPA